MKERPILFSGPMVRSILKGRKTHTRRVVKPQPLEVVAFLDSQNAPTHEYGLYLEGPRVISKHVRCPYGQPGDRLWVRETHALNVPGCEAQGGVSYRADHIHPQGDGSTLIKWRPSIHMPRWASRLTLEITGVRVERLQDITEEDAIAEGAFKQGKVGDDSVASLWTMTGEGWRYDSAREAFAAYWQSLNAKRPGYTWADNPWLWVVEFQRVEN